VTARPWPMSHSLDTVSPGKGPIRGEVAHLAGANGLTLCDQGSTFVGRRFILALRHDGVTCSRCRQRFGLEAL
jgi:hypothetical protein